MYENMTRKGLALGAGVALVATSFGVLPASAVTHTAGTNDGSVSLVPTAGTAYSVLTDGTFDLSANYDASLTASSRFLKFLVKDTGSQVKVDVDENQSSNDTAYDHTVAVEQPATADLDATDDEITVTSVVAHNLQSGDRVIFDGTSFTTNGTSPTNYKTTGVEVTVVDATSFTIPTVADATTVTAGADDVVVKFVSSEVTAASGEERTGDDYLTVVVDNSSQFMPGDTVDFVTSTDGAGTAGDVTDGTNNFGNVTGLTVIAVDDASNSVTVSKSSLAVDEDGTFAVANNPRLKLATAGGDDTALSARDDIAGKALGNFRILGGNTELKVSARDTDGSFVVTANDNTVANDMVLRLVNTDTTESYSVDVIAWVDNNGNGAIDLTEKVSPTRTVNFYENDELTVVTTMTTPVIGDSGIDATIAISPELNGQQVGNAATEVTATWTLQASSVNTNTATYNTVTKVWDVEMDLNGADTVVEGSYSVKAKVNATAIGNTSSVLVGARTAADTLLTMVANNDQQAAKDKDGDSNDAADQSTIRKGKSAVLVITAFDGDQDLATSSALGAGKSVTVDFSSATTTTDWTVNGVKVLDNAASGSKVYTTDANGQVTLTVSSTSGAAGDTITIDARPENLAEGDATAEVVLTWAAASYSIVDLNDPDNAAVHGRNLVKGGSMTLDLFAGDQWNAPLTGNYRLQMTLSGQSDGTTNVDFSTGRATYTIADEALNAGGTIGVATQLQKLGTTGVWANSTDAADLADITVTVSADPTTSVVVSTTYTDGSDAGSTATTVFLTADELEAYHDQTSQSALVAPFTAADDTAHIALTAGTGVAVGDTVTVSGEGLWFSYLDGGIAGTIKMMSQNSLTFVLDNTSDVIGVHSNVYKKDAVVTVTSRGRSGTTKVTTGVAGPDSGVEFVIDAPASVNPGSTFKVTGTLKDAFGNVVDATDGDVSVTYTGPGIVFGTLPTDTNAAGQFSFAVLLGANDSGPATIAVTYDLDGDGILTDDVKNFTTSKVVTVGVAGNTGAYSSWTKKLDDNSAKMYAKNVVGEGKVQFFLNGEEIAWVRAVDATDPKLRTANGSAYLVRTVEFEDGKNVLEIYVDGVRTTRTAYTK